MMNRCYFCSGELEEQLTTFVYAEDDIVWIIRQVPTYVCKQCGEKEYGQETTHHILSLLQHPPRPTEILHVPVYDWSSQLTSSSVKSPTVLAA
jgi:YgiT-type zinc finger domain-containing protein